MKHAADRASAAEDTLREARRAFSEGDVLVAIDGLQRIPAPDRTPAAWQLLASALLRAGAVSQAREVLQTLVAHGHQDEETLGLVAREAKARWLAGEPQALLEAQAAYEQAFERTGGTWTGVNAATLALVAGHADLARSLAWRVQERLTGVAAGDAGTFWHEATCGEVALLLGQLEPARTHYAAARALAPRAWGDLHAVRRNAQAVLRAQGWSPDALADLFPRISVVVFTGHMVDHADRASPRFPATDEIHVQRVIDAALAEHEVVLGVAGAACGADILFLEAVHRHGGETFVVLPHGIEDFRRTSVVEVGGPSWGSRFDAALARCRDLTLLSDHPGDDLSYQFQGAVMAGLARLKAQTLGGTTRGFAYWDGKPGGVGGTGMVVQEWQRSGLAVHKLAWQGPSSTDCSVMVGSHQPAVPLSDPRAVSDQRVVAMLFADAVGFSKLAERQVRTFVEAFWGRVAALLGTVPLPALLTTNTWGDGLFLVFSDVIEAARLASALARLAAQTDWAALGLTAHTNLRIALHAGPVYEMTDPIVRRPGFAGTHISRAARIEPVTPPGQVYVSEAYAALLALDDRAGEFRCEYMGSVPLAKDYGRLRTYRLSSGSSLM